MTKSIKLNRWMIPTEWHGGVVEQLAALAKLNCVFAVDIMERVERYLSGQGDHLETFLEALECSGIDPQQVHPADGATADDLQRAPIVRLKRLLEERNERILAAQALEWDDPPEVPTPIDSDAPAPKVKVKKLWGFPATAIIRWMGKEEFKFPEAKQVCATLNLDVADATIRAQLSAGKKGERGDPAKLNQTQIDKIKESIPS